MFFVYVLLSLSDKTTYIGSTDNVEKRLKDHNQGKTKSIKHKLPMELVYYEALQTSTKARKREIELKKNSDPKFTLNRLYKFSSLRVSDLLRYPPIYTLKLGSS